MDHAAARGSGVSSSLSLHVGLALTGMTPFDLYLAHVGLTGHLSPAEVVRTLDGSRCPSPLEHDVLALALNEQCLELGLGRPVPQADELGL